MKYLIMYKGPATPPDASHEGWPEWFEKVSGQLVDSGSPMFSGISIRSTGDVSVSSEQLNGYAIVEAEDVEELHSLVADHPYLALGEDYSIEAFEIPRK